MTLYPFAIDKALDMTLCGKYRSSFMNFDDERIASYTCLVKNFIDLLSTEIVDIRLKNFDKFCMVYVFLDEVFEDPFRCHHCVHHTCVHHRYATQ